MFTAVPRVRFTAVPRVRSRLRRLGLDLLKLMTAALESPDDKNRSLTL